MKILYFTSTGNCLYVAKQIGGELLSIPQLKKDGIYQINDDAVGIVFPCYGFDVPRPVRQYLEKVSISANFVFTIMTYGKFSMAGLYRMEELLKKRGVTVDYSNQILMVDNYLPNFDMTNQMEIKKDSDINSAISVVASDIKAQKHSLLHKGAVKRMISELSSSYTSSPKGAAMMNHSDEKFVVNNSCTECGICINVCPMANIKGTGKPEFQHQCEFCLACIHQCPQNAIHLKGEQSAVRFRNSHIKLPEIIAANHQK